MTIETELKKAQATGVTIGKEKLAAIIRASNQPRYPVSRGRSDQDYVIVLLPKAY